ncbi:Transposon Ty3-G Gag-Pol polyprotein [Araneus ventricosus]|uniref:Transposon Ty3-G Gag-Pol polyprotein n=1 Tax=Araneus ventricosus TaxID=182803 RepID=A0A4Y2BB57_ARAVE|nr:Transposon Ty3-G Gag-Pol polyprotein [Araneus ventricosus]
MDIKEVEGSKPVYMKPYKTNAPERAAIKEIVREWKENGIVSDTRSPYASPVLLVKKKTGENRLVIDYRHLNSQTIKDKFPLPKIDDLLEQLHDCSFFKTLDLAHGYLQIPLTENAKQKTAFMTPDETGQLPLNELYFTSVKCVKVFSVFPLSSFCVLHYEFLSTDSSNSPSYSRSKENYLSFLRCLREAIRRKRAEMWLDNSWILHRDNAPPTWPVFS